MADANFHQTLGYNMNTTELIEALDQRYGNPNAKGLELIQEAIRVLRNQQERLERMIEKQSHYEAMAHAGGFEAGRELGMKQERALWQLAASTQEIEK